MLPNHEICGARLVHTSFKHAATSSLLAKSLARPADVDLATDAVTALSQD